MTKANRLAGAFILLLGSVIYLCAEDSTTTNAPSESEATHIKRRLGREIATNSSDAKTNSDSDEEDLAKLMAKADEGDSVAQERLGFKYLLGSEPCQKDVNEACKWFRKAADHGEVRMQTLLAAILRNGSFFSFVPEVDKNPNEAAKWYLRAARQGDHSAQIKIGDMFANGEGVMQDFVEAYKWFNIASMSTAISFGAAIRSTASPDLKKKIDEWEASTNYQNSISASLNESEADEARRKRAEVAERMTPEQIAEAQRLARKFKPAIEGAANASDDSDVIASGTGFFITEDGFLITNEHVVKEATQVRLLTRAGIISAKVVKVDAANDLALLKAEGKFSALPVAASRAARLGSTVATVGFPNIGLQGFAPKFARGEIAALSGAQDDARFFQISVPVQPGNSGGALVDERGNVVGVVAAKLSAKAALTSSGALPENVNYAVKSSFLLGFLESVPEVSAKLKEAIAKERKFEDVVKAAEEAAVLVLVY